MKNEDQFRKLVLEQSTKLQDLRVPIARASLAVTLVLYEHFDIEKGEADDAQRYAVMESRNNFEKAFKPLLLHWSRLHTAGLNAFLRLWKATGAEVEDFDKVAELVRILVEQVVGQAPRTRDISEAEVELQDFDYHKLRELQMELLELAYEDAWGHHLRYVRTFPLLYEHNADICEQTSTGRTQPRSFAIRQGTAYSLPPRWSMVSPRCQLRRFRTCHQADNKSQLTLKLAVCTVVTQQTIPALRRF
jgi:hypothetical protein